MKQYMRSGLAIAAVITLASPCSAGPATVFRYRTPDIVAYFDATTGSATVRVGAMIFEQNGVSAPTYGFAMGLAHDPGLLTATFVEPVGPLPGIGGGAGPEFFGVTIYPGAVTVVVLYDAASLETLIFDTEVAVLSVHYSANPAVLLASMGPVSSMIEFDDSFGSPPVENRVVTSATGTSVVPTQVDGTVTLLPALAFVRGECNADGMVDLADAVTVLGILFGSMGAVDCMSACDANDDHAVDIGDGVHLLQGLFLSGPDPAPPFPGCGVDPTPDSLPCVAYPPC